MLLHSRCRGFREVLQAGSLLGASDANGREHVVFAPEHGLSMDIMQGASTDALQCTCSNTFSTSALRMWIKHMSAENLQQDQNEV